jgi:hypothetical protein
MWILVFLIVKGPMVTMEFTSKNECLEAAAQIKKDLGLMETKTKFSCVRSD